MNNSTLCIGCMENKGVSNKCPFCGYEEDTVPESLLHLPPGTILQDKYLLGQVLGQGGFGITYIAWDKTLRIKLAIKEYLPQQLATRTGGSNKVTVYKASHSKNFNYGLTRFLEEAQTLARFIEHPNVVSVRDYFEANGTAYLVMNYLEGVTLQSYLDRKGGKIPVEQALSIFMPVLDALKEVHAAGILHRDISPDNLLIDKSGRVVLIDFGAARQAMSDKSKSLSVIMKAGYSPPEQYQSRGKQGPWTDVYAVAASIYRSITGQVPLEAIDRMTKDDLVSPSIFGIDIDTNLEKVLLKALSVKAEDRYQRVLGFQEAVTEKEKSERSTEKNREDKQKKEVKLDSETRKLESELEQVVKIKPQEKAIRITKKIAITAICVMIVSFLYFIFSSLISGNMADKRQDNLDGALEEKVTASVVKESDALGTDQELRGNSIGNIVNVGIAATEGDWVYYRRAEADFVIYKKRTDGNEHFMVVNDDAWNMNIQDGWLYYSNRAENFNVYKVRTDGSGRTMINSDDSGNLQLVDRWLYYRNDDDDGRIYRIRTDGSERTRFDQRQAFFLNVVGQWIYYQNRTDGGRIYKVKTNGTQNTRINSEDSWNINVSGDWIYYSTPNEGWNIYKVRLDGTERTRLNSDDSGNLNVVGDWIYYRNDSDSGRLYKILTDGRGRTRLNMDQSYFPSVHGEWVYYQNRSDNRRTYKIRVDGTERQPVY